VAGPVLLVVAAVEVPRPTPFLRARDQGAGIGGPDLGPIVEERRADLVHRGAGRADVAVGGEPEARLVVEDVVAHAARARGPPARDHVLDEPLLEGRAGGHVRVVWVVPGDGRAVRSAHTVAGI